MEGRSVLASYGRGVSTDWRVKNYDAFGSLGEPLHEAESTTLPHRDLPATGRPVRRAVVRIICRDLVGCPKCVNAMPGQGSPARELGASRDRAGAGSA